MENKEGNPTFMEAVTGPDAASFLIAMKKEVATLDNMETFDIVTCKPWMKVISSVWVFKRKRYLIVSFNPRRYNSALAALNNTKVLITLKHLPQLYNS